jgi:hypothetical protein
MKRLTIHLRKVKKERIDGKSIIRNTLSFQVKDDVEAQSIVANYNKNNNVKKWYTSNIK